MKALILEQFGRLILDDLPAPEPGPQEVLIQVEATGICGTDVHGFTGENGRRHPGQIMGHESVGRVAGLGQAARGGPLQLGEPVSFNPVVIPETAARAYAGREQLCPDRYVIGVRPDVAAAFAEYLCVPARNVVALPSTLPHGHGALIEPMAVALHAVERAAVRPGDRVFVAGGGPIGQSIVLALREREPAQIVVSEPLPSRRALLGGLGATAVEPPDAGRPFPAGWADVAFDAVGTSGSLADCACATTLGTTVVLVGMGAPQLHLDSYAFSTAERTLRGSFTYSRNDFRAAAALIAADPSGVERLISDRVAPERAPHWFTALAAGSDVPGKVLVCFDRDGEDSGALS